MRAQAQFALLILQQASQLAQLAPQGAQLWQHRLEHGRVTEADYAVQALVGRKLAQVFPSDALLAEESSQGLLEQAEGLAHVTARVQHFIPESTEERVLKWIAHGEGHSVQRFWTLDPIDSTSGLIRSGTYSLNLALVEDGQVQLGAMAFPNFGFAAPLIRSGVIFLAIRDHGAWWSSLNLDPMEPMQVSSQTDLAQATRLRSLSRRHKDQNEADQALRDRVTAELQSTRAVRSRAPLRYPLVACGQGDILLRMVLSATANQNLMIWDHAAGALLVEEAGGRITDLDGQPLDFSTGRILTNNRGLLATNGLLHPTCLEALRRAGA